MRAGMVLLWVVVVVAACGGGGKNAKSDEPLGKQQHVDGPAPGGGGGGGASDAPLGEAECAGLYDHIVELAKLDIPAEEWPDARDALEMNRPDAIEGCQGGKVTRPQFECFMKAAKWDELAACAPPETGE